VATIVTVCKQEPGNPTNGWSLVEVTVAVHGPFPIGESDGVLAGAVASKLVLSFCGDVGAVGGLVVLPCGDTGAAGGLGLLFGGDTGTAGGLVLLVSGSIGAAGELTLIGVAFKLVVWGSGLGSVGLTWLEGGEGLGTDGVVETDTTTCSDVEGTGAGEAAGEVVGSGAASECDVGTTGVGVGELPPAITLALVSSLLSSSNPTAQL
jgi:hypothetical protein